MHSQPTRKVTQPAAGADRTTESPARKARARCRAAALCLGVVLLLLHGPAPSAQVQQWLEGLDPSLSSDRLTARQEAAVSLLLLSTYAAGTMDATSEVTIDGSFEGWDGDTIVKLTDGAVLQQSSYEYAYCYAYLPSALLSCSVAGCQIRVDDSGCSEPVDVDVLSTGRNYSLNRYEQFQSRMRQAGFERVWDLMRRIYP